MYNENRYVGVIVYFTVMFDHPSCFLTFAVLVSLHPATFLMFFITCLCNFFGSRRMFELKFAAEVSDLTGNWAVARCPCLGIWTILLKYYTSSIG